MLKAILARFVTGLILVTASAICWAQPAEPKFSDLTILVPSCDKYSSLWEPFFTLLKRNWPSLETYNKDVPILFIVNKKSYLDPRVQTISIPNEVSWSDNMIQALQQVKTKYVLILLEDYILNTAVDEENLAFAYKFLQHNSGAYIMLSGYGDIQELAPEVASVGNISMFSKNSNWRTSLQACIWDKEAMLWLLKSGESAWDFEKHGSSRSEGYPKPFYVVTSKHPIKYLNAAALSILNTSVIQYIEAQGIPFHNETLLVDTEFKAKWKRFVREASSKMYNTVVKPGLVFARKLV